MLTGEYRNAVDEKGRLLVPSRVRNEIAGSMLVVTRGLDTCLWLFEPEVWTQFSEKIMGATSPFDAKARVIQRRIIAPAQEIEIDKAGRITIPQTLRDYAKLKKDSVILGIKKYLELWDENEYLAYCESTEEAFQESAEELGGLVPF